MSLSKGIWLVMTNGNWSSSFSQASNTTIRNSAGTILSIKRGTGLGGGDFFSSAIVNMSSDDTIKAVIYQASGAAQTISWLGMQAVRIG
jgi:hypothetical protein